MYLTILMPCLNEEQTIAECIINAKKFLLRSDISGEILISDNGSTDNRPPHLNTIRDGLRHLHYIILH